MRLREPAAWVALGALVLNIVLAIVAMATYPGPTANVGLVLSARAANPVPLVVLAVLVSFCVVRERTPHARLLTILSLIVGVIAVLLGLTLALLGLAAEPTPVLAVLAAIVTQLISLIAVVLLIKLLQLQAVPRRLPAGIGLAPYPEVLAGTAAPGPAAATNLATRHGCRRGLAYRGRGSSWRAGNWLGGGFLRCLAADPDATQWARGRRAGFPTTRPSDRQDQGTPHRQRWTGGAGLSPKRNPSRSNLSPISGNRLTFGY